MKETPDADAPRPAEEDLGRANLYALIGRLFYAAPEAQLCEDIRRIDAGDEPQEHGESPLSSRWRALQEACANIAPAVIRQEHDDLFVGVGRAPVTPYLSGYAEPAAPDRYLVRLREQLLKWGFSRQGTRFEVEDHVSALCDVMRLLIEAGRPLAEQRGFFMTFLYPGAIRFLVALQQAPFGDFYKGVGAFAEAFFEVEKEGLEMIASE